MSASSKKKLRNAQEAEKMTEKQLKEQQDAKKLKLYTTIAVVVLAVMVVFAVWTAASNMITHSGIRERSTTALTIGEHEISNAELNIFFIDAVNEFYSQYADYISMLGLNTALPLDKQISNETTGTTWADDFLTTAKDNACSVYALNDAAAEAGFTLSEEERAYVDSLMANFELYATAYGYSNTDDYLKAMYGNGANEKFVKEYLTKSYTASAYQAKYSEELSYDDAAIAAESEKNGREYCDYTFNYYYVSADRFLEGGTTADDGTVIYSDDEKAAAVKAAEAAAKALAEGEYATAADFDAAIAEMEINADAETAPTSTSREDYAYTGITATLKDWVSDPARKAGETTFLPSNSTTTAEDGTETTVTNGYYVALYFSTNDNEYPLANVRHILVAFEGGSYDSTTGLMTYTDEEKAAAKSEAESILAQFESGEKTEDAFGTLANEKSADVDPENPNGGLYTDVYPGQMVTNFNDWCFDDSRKVGDTGIVETEYGYHVMYYSGDSETTYREYLITNALRTADANAWYTALIEAVGEPVDQEIKYISTDLVLSSY